MGLEHSLTSDNNSMGCDKDGYGNPVQFEDNGFDCLPQKTTLFNDQRH